MNIYFRKIRKRLLRILSNFVAMEILIVDHRVTRSEMVSFLPVFLYSYISELLSGVTLRSPLTRFRRARAMVKPQNDKIQTEPVNDRNLPKTFILAGVRILDTIYQEPASERNRTFAYYRTIADLVDASPVPAQINPQKSVLRPATETLLVP